MNRPYPHIEIERREDVFCVRLRFRRLEETDIYELANELIALGAREGCRKLALSLGPGSPDCIYSVFLAKLISIQRVLREQGGEMVLCDLTPEVHAIFEACSLDSHFTFLADFDDAVAHWAK